MRLNKKLLDDNMVVNIAKTYGIDVELNSDGSIVLYHGTSKKAADSIEDSNSFFEGSYFSHSKHVTGYGDSSPLYYATVKHKDGKVLKINVDTNAISFCSGTGEFYAEDGLILNQDTGIWGFYAIK